MSFIGFYQQFLTEKRSSPKQYVVDILEKYKDDPDVYISFTQDLSGPKLGINPKSKYSTPLGIYAYPLKIMWDTIKGYSEIPFANQHPNLYVFKPKDPSKVLYNSKYTMADYKKDTKVEDPKETENFIHARDVYQHPEDHPEEIVEAVRILIKPLTNLYFSYFHSKGFIYGMIKGFYTTKYYKITADEKKICDIINITYAKQKSRYRCEKVKINLRDENYALIKNGSKFTFISNIDMIEQNNGYSEDLGWDSAMREILKVYTNFTISEEEFALQLFPYFKITDHNMYDILYGQYGDDNLKGQYHKTPAQSFMTYYYEKSNGEPIKWAKLMRDKGYVGISDDTGQGIIHFNEPTQAVFFKLRDLKVLELIKNKGLANWKPVETDYYSGIMRFFQNLSSYDQRYQDLANNPPKVNVQEFYMRLFRFLLTHTIPKIEHEIYKFADDSVKPKDKPRTLKEYAGKIADLENVSYNTGKGHLGNSLRELGDLLDSVIELKDEDNRKSNMVWDDVSSGCYDFITQFIHSGIYPNFKDIVSDKINDILEITKKKSERVDESFNIDLDHAYDLFQQEYNNATGQSWSKEKFLNRAHNWQFYGDEQGFIAVRPQQSGFCKLVGSAGNNKSKYKGFKEALSQGLPLWGMVSKDIVGLLLKLGFKAPNFIERKMLEKMLSKQVLGDAEIIEHTKDGGVTLRYSDIGVVTKYFVGSPAYWKKLYSLKHLLKN
jgi:hypothetical protein